MYVSIGYKQLNLRDVHVATSYNVLSDFHLSKRFYQFYYLQFLSYTLCQNVTIGSSKCTQDSYIDLFHFFNITVTWFHFSYKS